jgi:glutamate/aspartate transport system permease protein
MNYHWNWSVFFQIAPDGTHTYLISLLWGLFRTLITALFASAIAFFLGSAIGVARTLPNRWALRAANAYIELFRNIPLIVQMFVWYFVVPELVPKTIGMWIKGLEYGSLYIATFSLGLFAAARVAIQLSSGIAALPKGQPSAGYSLGMTLPQVYKLVLLPQAYRIVFPTLTNELLNVIKNTAVASTIGLVELSAQARSMEEFSFQVFEAFAGATALYLLVNVSIVAALGLSDRRFQTKELRTGLQ